MSINQLIEDARVVPVVVLERLELAVPTAQALLRGGLPLMEVTLRTDCALGAIREISSRCPEVCVGAGTVTCEAQACAAVDAGAKFIVSPGLDVATVRYCVANDIPVFPGCVTPTEIMAALAEGLRVVKFFPANVYGGAKALRALAAPFGDVRFIPTGGVNENNLKEYLDEPAVFAIGGSYMCTSKDIKAGNFRRIEELTRTAIEAVEEWKAGVQR